MNINLHILLIKSRPSSNSLFNDNNKEKIGPLAPNLSPTPDIQVNVYRTKTVVEMKLFRLVCFSFLPHCY